MQGKSFSGQNLRGRLFKHQDLIENIGLYDEYYRT
jgi:hypothetical protein